MFKLLQMYTKTAGLEEANRDILSYYLIIEDFKKVQIFQSV
jgi:hypothetical protein